MGNLNCDNYDWYSPSNARRYSEQEVRDLVKTNGLKIGYFHQRKRAIAGVY